MRNSASCYLSVYFNLSNILPLFSYLTHLRQETTNGKPYHDNAYQPKLKTMKKLNLIAVLWCLLSSWAVGQTIQTDPEFVNASEPVTITIDVTGNTQLENLTEAWAWVWVIEPEGLDEPNAPTNVNPATAAQDAAKFTNVGGNVWEITFTPTTFLNQSVIEKIGVILKGQDWSDGQTQDFMVDILQDESLSVQFTSPTGDVLVAEGETIDFELKASSAATLTLSIGGQQVAQEDNATVLTYEHTVGEEEGEVTVVGKGSSGMLNDEKTLKYTIIPPVEVVPRPELASMPGINYVEGDPTKAYLVLQDPAKKKAFVYAVGDFNEWTKDDNSSLMKKSEEEDANYFWIELTGLEAQKEYIFQYDIDGELRIADPYAEKISDPLDWEIDEERYEGGVLPYPEEEAMGFRASYLQTGQEPYTWTVTDFERPHKDKLVIQEILIRDFTDESTYNAALEHLDYLKEMGINAIELMPVGEFEGNNSWGYNPNFYFAPDKYYGTKNDLKAFIDACHEKGMAVILDMVLNHQYHSSSLVRMYNEGDYGNPTADNPWFNTESPNPVFSFGADLNHESDYTKELIDRVNKFWLEEYNVDGYRFDFTKGMTNTPGEGSAKDDARIEILKRMASEIRKVDPNAYIILEHFAENSEEQILVADGMQVWGNSNYDFRDTGKGGTANLDWQYAGTRDMPQLGLVSYMESHDEERVMYDALTNGKKMGSYNVKNKQTALQRLKQNAAFFFLIPGAKMVWQFGELGYDVSINQKEVGGEVNEAFRTDPKPVLWEYKDDPERFKVYQVYQALISLRNEKSLYNLAEHQVKLSLEAGKRIKYYELNGLDGFKVRVIGNFGLTPEKVSGATSLQNDVEWFDYFDGGSSFMANHAILAPGEFKILVNQEVDFPEAGLVEMETAQVATAPVTFDINTSVTVYFDPSIGNTDLEDAEEVYMVSGLVMDSENGLVLEKVVGETNEDTQAMMEKDESGFWKLTMTPAEYFELMEGEAPFRLGVYFRNTEGTVTVKDKGTTPYFFQFINYPQEMWMVGDFGGVGWDLTKAPKMEQLTNGVFTLDVSLNQSNIFKFIDSNVSFGEGTEYGSQNNEDLIIADGEGNDISAPETGDYRVVADLIQAKVFFEDPNTDSDANDILKFLVAGEETVIDKDSHTVTGALSPQTDLENIMASVTISPGATISPDPSQAQDYSSPVVYTVTSVGGTAQEWTVTFTLRDPSSENDILAFELEGVAGTIDNEEYTVSVGLSDGTDLTALRGMATVSKYATISPDPTQVMDYSEGVTFTVTAEDGTEQDWLVTALITALDEDILKRHVKLYPNPVEDFVSLNIDGFIRGKIGIEIYDLTGKSLITWDDVLSQTQQRLDISSLNSGIYLIEVRTDKGRLIHKLIKQ